MGKPRIRKTVSGWQCGDRPKFGNGPTIEDSYFAWCQGMYFAMSLRG